MFGEKLRKLRTRKGLTQDEVTKACGITGDTYYSYEWQGFYPREREVYDKLAELFGVDRDDLLTAEEAEVAESFEKYGMNVKERAGQLLREMREFFAVNPPESVRGAIMSAMQNMCSGAEERDIEHSGTQPNA